MRRPLAALTIMASLSTSTPAGATRGGCYDAVEFLWPRESRAWAHRIVWRESRGDPWAQNRRSSAAGCFQLLRLHAPRFRRLGFSWANRYDPMVNAWVALDLYREQGQRPWKVRR